jgi:uncharacterized protein (TIGR01777 family)
MSLLMVLLATQITLGAIDTLWHHEIAEQLPSRRQARLESALHAVRETCYAVLFLALAWRTWHGAWVAAIVTLLALEAVVTLADFVVEDRTRRLPATERVLHTVLAINFGALLAVFAPTLIAWARLPTAIVPADYGVVSWLLVAAAVGVLAFGVRNGLAARRHFAAPAWERRGLHPKRRPDARHVLVSGATGFIGTKLVDRLIGRGDRVTVLARNRAKALDLFGPHVEIVDDLTALPATTPIDAIVNLAGESIAGGLWTKRRRALLLESRLGVTRALLALVARLATPPTTWVNASAVGYYGARDGDEALHEKSSSGTGFQAELCRAWEETAALAAERRVRVTALRIGVVLGRDGGALPSLARPVHLFAGAVLGSGRQWFSWIHVDDLLALVLFVLDEQTLAGPINATAPEPARHRDVMTAIAAALGRPLWPLRIPARLLGAVLGELAELFVAGQRVVPERALALGFAFRHATIDDACADLLARRRAVDAPPRVRRVNDSR